MIALSPKECRCLRFFLRQPRQVSCRQQLELNLWEWDNQPKGTAVIKARDSAPSSLKSLWLLFLGYRR
ncbi:helix-turn-helix domain-containing protein [Thermosynechococcus sp.]|uniref:helix-turn-helix domain-containing protein n=1 Tax=Thermosynechococcus sp. TaxID=2814275 RepID=UPI00391AF8DE